MDNCVIYCTVPNDFSANLIASTLIDENLAACVNIVPSVTSVYKWEGSVQTDSELLLIIKTQQSKFNDVEKRIKELHENSIPEIIALPIIKGSEEYQNWIIKETSC